MSIKLFYVVSVFCFSSHLQFYSLVENMLMRLKQV